MFLTLAALFIQTSTLKFGSVTDPATATVSRTSSGWEVEYQFVQRSPIWAFPVSATKYADHLPWRAKTWQVLTRRVRIERRGEYDVLVPTEGTSIPKSVRIAFAPLSATLDREYDPAITFSNGATALYSEQFNLVAAADGNALAKKPSGLSAEDLGGRPIPIRFRDVAGPVFAEGQRHKMPKLVSAETYVVFGAAKIENFDGLAMLADPKLPAWLKKDIASFAPLAATIYAKRLGERRDQNLPLLLLGWRGATSGKVINDGGVRPGQMILNFEGEGLIDRNEKAVRRTRWFIAHEMAHFWLGTSGVRYRSSADAWITEGGADMLAFTLLAKSDKNHATAELQRAFDDCAKLAGKPLQSSGDRKEGRAYYACGAIFALGAKSAAQGAMRGDYFAFLKPLLAQHQVDRVIGAEDWLSHFLAATHSARATNQVRQLLSDGSDDPKRALEEFLVATGVPHRKEGDIVTLLPTIFE